MGARRFKARGLSGNPSEAMERDNKDHNGVVRAFRSSGMLAFVPSHVGLVEAQGLSGREQATHGKLWQASLRMLGWG